ncbi:predicted protein [Plenodomus lingam JN3]|uniref:Predicted protein n=1 Tax=Leptosphaeria maculans (strain JN3 / isolate v23.1.3 / race Av1-4-5-6-7-8) TaxID=985895 RepID=E5A5N2_LEPMJ|nr:predicted protein [Plenodomus lingam JN3]CBX98930.1 predicted protein [Plenodomus lingam JN3]
MTSFSIPSPPIFKSLTPCLNPPPPPLSIKTQPHIPIPPYSPSPSESRTFSKPGFQRPRK